MDVYLRILAGAVVGYLTGGIPFGLLVGKLFFKTDVREHGSGNIGATNVLRVLGPVAGVSTFALDFAKGAASLLIAALLVPQSTYGATLHEWAGVAAFIAVMLGHSYSPYLGFSGGKGVAPAAGAIVVLFTWQVFAALAVIFSVVVVASRMVSLGSIAVALAFPAIVAIVYPRNVPLIGFAILAAAIVVWRHRANVVRIARGEEARIDPFKRAETSPAPRQGKER